MEYGKTCKTQDKPFVAALYSEDLCHTTAVQSLMQYNYHKVDIMEAVKRFIDLHGHTYFSAEDLLKLVLERHTYQYAVSSSMLHIETDCPETQIPIIKEEDTESILEENRRIEESKLCKICLENKVNVVFLPCGHICACLDCSPAIRKCAICREFIKKCNETLTLAQQEETINGTVSG
ncbi:unnamed protein product [Mytilus edulis]|uniref:RING-type domain-containing protein n=1 Tax=Mytilus edulis TaxID=6550 RepID=A0A8S3S1Z6_MYTED|nr:unnamed protein product [Mytilus edulis]